ncbi:MAG: SGNH/GDSL hydrolase family protein [Ruminococcaceae bacterium]|nr:SGNH/GDSL hydrolase family protein [Oscillospiraceae bacterium]
MDGKLYVYGDSLLKATVPDEEFRYHFHADELRRALGGVEVVNRAKMGATIRKGLSLVQHDLQRGLDGGCALVAYGGNDSDFDWCAVSEQPDGEHRPHTELPEFVRLLKETLDALRARGVQPVLMTLPPIDAQRYLHFICRGGLSCERIMHWLGDSQAIYRYQEMYSGAVAQLAAAEGVPLIPARQSFLCERSCAQMIAADGIHLTMEGYHRLYDTLAQWMKKNL